MYVLYLLLQSKIQKCVWVIQICFWEKAQFDFSHWLKKGRLVSKRLIYYIINIKSPFHRGLCLSEKNLGQNFPSASKSNYYNSLETSTQVDSWEVEGKSEIAVIPNKYKDTLNDLIDSSDIESSNHLDSLN